MPYLYVCYHTLVMSEPASTVLHIQMNPASGVPVYRQIMDQIRHYVAARTLKPQDQLPSIRELARNLHVNPTTIVKAYTELAHEEVIEMRHGKGVFVAQGKPPPSLRAMEGDLRRIARQLAVEAAQMGTAPSTVQRILREEMENLVKEVRNE